MDASNATWRSPYELVSNPEKCPLNLPLVCGRRPIAYKVEIDCTGDPIHPTLCIGSSILSCWLDDDLTHAAAIPTFRPGLPQHQLVLSNTVICYDLVRHLKDRTNSPVPLLG